MAKKNSGASQNGIKIGKQKKSGIPPSKPPSNMQKISKQGSQSQLSLPSQKSGKTSKAKKIQPPIAKDQFDNLISISSKPSHSGPIPDSVLLASAGASQLDRKYLNSSNLNGSIIQDLGEAGDMTTPHKNSKGLDFTYSTNIKGIS